MRREGVVPRGLCEESGEWRGGGVAANSSRRVRERSELRAEIVGGHTEIMGECREVHAHGDCGSSRGARGRLRAHR